MTQRGLNQNGGPDERDAPPSSVQTEDTIAEFARGLGAYAIEPLLYAPTIETCPLCGGSAREVLDWDRGPYVECSSISCELAVARWGRDSADAWNLLARAHREAPELRARVAELEAERDALIERLARRDDEVRRLEVRR